MGRCIVISRPLLLQHNAFVVAEFVGLCGSLHRWRNLQTMVPCCNVLSKLSMAMIRPIQMFCHVDVESHVLNEDHLPQGVIHQGRKQRFSVPTYSLGRASRPQTLVYEARPYTAIPGVWISTTQLRQGVMIYYIVYINVCISGMQVTCMYCFASRSLQASHFSFFIFRHNPSEDLSACYPKVKHTSSALNPPSHLVDTGP